jgi:hypothetical protein
MKIGDKVRVVRLPSPLPDGDMGTKALFQDCVNHVFPVASIVTSAKGRLFELEVGEVRGQPAYMHSIWIEEEYVALA